ncbi:MAG TPA: molybdenum cofactor guanylyltransferase [Polyangia bacterium]|jgi:molybdopterin-guanine dinucleotide biosynthesis protein A
MKQSMSVAAAIIAGGPARRLGGVAKPFLTVGGRTIAERQLEVLRATFPRVLVVANDPAPWAALGVEVVADRVAGAGPMGGLQAALAAAGDSDAMVCVGGDLPFLEPALLAALRDGAPEAAALVPRTAIGAEPLCARYGRLLLPAVDTRVKAGQLALHTMLEEVFTVWIEGDELAALDPDGRSFFNINTPDDLRRADALAVKSGPRP